MSSNLPVAYWSLCNLYRGLFPVLPASPRLGYEDFVFVCLIDMRSCINHHSITANIFAYDNVLL